MILPEGISFFGQSLTSRFADLIELITGSLPAQYGLVTTGIVDITTKSGAFQPGGSVGFYGGSHGWMEPSFEYAGSAGSFNYYVTGDLLEMASVSRIRPVRTIGSTQIKPGKVVFRLSRRYH